MVSAFLLNLLVFMSLLRILSNILFGFICWHSTFHLKVLSVLHPFIHVHSLHVIKPMQHVHSHYFIVELQLILTVIHS